MTYIYLIMKYGTSENGLLNMSSFWNKNPTSLVKKKNNIILDDCDGIQFIKNLSYKI